MQSTLSFLSSVVSNVAAELVGSALFAHNTRLDLDLDSGVSPLGQTGWLYELASSFKRNTSTRVRPSERSASAIKAETVSDRTAPASSPGSERQGEVARDRRCQMTRLFVATKVAHEDLGERCAMFIGCSLAVAYAEGLVIADTAAKVVILMLLEALTDLGKVAIFRACQIEIGRVRFHLHVWAIVAVALVGATGCGAVASGIRINCMIGDGVEALLG